MQVVLNFPKIETERLILRGPKPADFEVETAFLASDRAKYMGGPLGRVDAWRRFTARFGSQALRGFSMFTVTLKGDDTPIGLIGPHYPETWNEPELGWAMYGNAEGKGYAFEAATAARNHAYGTLGWATAISYIVPENTRSRALAERLGCVLDPDVTPPFDVPCLVYRHPAPEDLT